LADRRNNSTAVRATRQRFADQLAEIIPDLVRILDDRPSLHSFLAWYLWKYEAPADAAASSPTDIWLTIYGISNDENLARRFDRCLPEGKPVLLRELHAKGGSGPDSLVDSVRQSRPIRVTISRCRRADRSRTG